MNERGAALVKKAGLTQEEIGEALGVTQSSVCRKLAGTRPWSQQEVAAILALLSKRLGRRVTYEQVFGAVGVSA